jgi:hypothetical protein
MKTTLLTAFLITMIIGGLAFTPGLNSAKAQAPTQVSGEISSDTLWAKASSPYTLTGPINVDSNATLTIEAGTTIDTNSYYLAVYGILFAKGTSSDPICINGGNNIYPIDFEFSKSWSEKNASGSIIENAILSSAPIDILDSSPKISNNTLQESKIYIDGGSAVVTNNTLTNCNISFTFVEEGSPILANNTIINGTISVNNGAPIPNFMIIANNTITNSGQNGVEITGGYADVYGNRISGGQCGIEVNNGYPYTHDNRISNCQYGILLSSFSDPSNIIGTSPLIENNLITNNSQGLNVWLSGRLFLTATKIYVGAISIVIQNNTIADNAIGLDLCDSNGTFPISNYTGGNIKASVYNSTTTILYNNFENNNQTSLYLKDTSIDINATHNWWGTTQTQTINESIYDSKDNATIGSVTFVPFLASPNPQATPILKSSAQPNPTITLPPPLSLKPSPSVPEFPTWTILSLCTMATLTAILMLRKKNTKQPYSRKATQNC